MERGNLKMLEVRERGKPTMDIPWRGRSSRRYFIVLWKLGKPPTKCICADSVKKKPGHTFEENS